MKKKEEKRIEELRNLVWQKEKEGKIVFWTIEGPVAANLDDFIKQPADGILYDLNRLEEVVLTFIGDPKWLNDYAVAQVIRKLKECCDNASSLHPFSE